MKIGKWEQCEGIEGLSVCVKKNCEFSFRLEGNEGGVEDNALRFLAMLKEITKEVEKTDIIENVTFEVAIKIKKEENL